MQLPKLTYRIQSLITAPEIDTDLLWGLSIFFVGLALVYFVSIFVFRNSISSKSSRTKQRKMELSPMVSEFLFYEDNVDVAEKSQYIRLKIEIRELLKDDFNRRVLTEILLDLRKDVSGDTQKRLFELYTDLGLEQDAFAKLESWRWEVISKGILELTLMQVDEAYTFIVKFINHRKGTIRKQAEIAAVTLQHEGINYFLDTTKYKISEWQQLKLLDVLRNKDDFKPPRFKAWLTATNRHVVLFALRLIKFYNQNDANAAVIELVKHKDQYVRRQAIDCIKEFYVIDALPTLKGVFSKCTIDTKIAILGAIAELGTTTDTEFLEAVSQSEGNFAVKSKAVGAINTIAPDSILPTENIEYVTDYKSKTANTETDIHTNTDLSKDSEEAVIALEQNDVATDAPVVVETIDIEIIDEADTEFGHPEKHLEEHPDEHPEIPDIEESTLQPKPLADEATEPEQSNNPSQNPTLMPEETTNDEALRNIEVTIEEVTAETSEENTGSPTNNFDISEIHFLPLVVAEKSDPATDESSRDTESENLKDTLPKSEGDTHGSGPVEEELRTLIDEIRELDFLPIVTEQQEHCDIEQTAENEDEASETLETIEGYSILDLEVNFEKVETPLEPEPVEAPEFDLAEAPITNESAENSEDVMSWLLEHNQLMEIECIYETVGYASGSEVSDHLIPEPVYYDDHETYMMGLLDDLEEMGDQREIPLLNELMTEESTDFIKDRITTMIAKFTRQSLVEPKKRAAPQEKAELPVFSVFADLFKNIDTEAKLILLDEVIHVGDEKEIEFLDGLLEDPDHNIRKKAQTMLQLLIAKLAHEKPGAIYSSGVSAIVSEYSDPTSEAEAKEYQNLLSEMDIAPSLSPEMLAIDFELCEILDKKYDQRILDIPVISIEVSPNGNGGSFFNTLRNLSKLF